MNARSLAAAAVLAASCTSTPPLTGDAGPTCASSLTLCSGSCVDLKTSDTSCGACGTACATGEGCAGSQCYPRACGTITCGPASVCVSGNCVDRSCFGVTCPMDQTCAAGQCLPHDCAGAPCAVFQVCVDNACVDSSCVGVLCPAGSTCRGGICGADTCSDSLHNGGETDLDCGGAFCPPCGAGKLCSIAQDCVTRRCENGVCASASCSDGLLNGNEGDVDCGGDCPLCATGKTCTIAAQCESGSCEQRTCAAASCADMVTNGTETDRDCGGSCPRCSDGKHCTVNVDCSSGYCTLGQCTSAACHDGALDGGETDLDCGGPCAPCGTGLKCLVPADCLSRACNAFHCSAPTCADLLTNGNETDTDCGGGTCPACGVGRGCKLGADCTSKVCSATDGGVCRAPACNDAVRNGQETDRDCGGGTCPGCGVGLACLLGRDCQSNTCDAGLCDVAPLFAATPAYLLPAGSGPTGMVVADLDKDGRPDIAISNGSSVDITLWYGQADGGFASGGALQVTGGSGFGGPHGVAVGDFDGDGKLDLVTTADIFPGAACRATWLRGLGGRTFASGVDTVANNYACSNVSAGDLNGDGYDDVVVGTYVHFGNPGGLMVFPGGLTGPGTGVETDNGGPSTPVVVDLDRDGNPDVLLRNSNLSAVFVRPGNGTSRPDAGSLVTFSAGDGELAAVDLNSDTYPDIVMPANNSNRVGVSLSVGGTSFLAAQSFPVNGAFAVAAGDVDHDGKIDLVLGTNSLAVLLGNGDGTFQAARYFGAAYGGGTVFHVALVDLDADGRLDALALTSSGVWAVMNTSP